MKYSKLIIKQTRNLLWISYIKRNLNISFEEWLKPIHKSKALIRISSKT